MSTPAQPNEQGPILVPVDFSPCSAAALRCAARLARALGAPLHVLHVIHDPASAPGAYAGAADDQGRLRPLEDVARQLLDEFLGRAAGESAEVAGLGELATSLVGGLVPTRILEVADRLGAQQIVMGSVGRTGLEHLLLGSKAQRVVQLSPIPVTIVKAPREDAARDESSGESNAEPHAEPSADSPAGREPSGS